MATKILAHPIDDKRKASSVSWVSGDVIDIRGFANFTVIVSALLGSAVTIKVCSTVDGTFATLNSLGGTSAALGTIAVTANEAYDVPELAGCHYLQFAFAGATTGTIIVMGKV